MHIIGRRGPVQAAFTTKELRELVRIIYSAVCLEYSNSFVETDEDNRMSDSNL